MSAKAPPDTTILNPKKAAKPIMNMTQRQVLDFLEKLQLPKKSELWCLYIEILQKILFTANNIKFENKIKEVLVKTYQDSPDESKALSFETMIKSLTKLMELRYK